MTGFSPGIKQGVATTLWVKNGKPGSAEVFFRNDIDSAKAGERRERLLGTLAEADFQDHYKKASPTPANRYSFWPSAVAPEYLQWPKIVDLCSVFSNGLMEKRGNSLISVDKDALSLRMKTYFDPEVDWDALTVTGHGLTKNYARFDAKKARKKVLTAEKFSGDRIVRYAVRPFDTQWCYYVAERPVWNEPRPQLWKQCWVGNSFILTRLRAGKDPEGLPVYYTHVVSDDHILSPDAIAIPAALEHQAVGITGPLLGDNGNKEVKRVSNLSGAARAYSTAIGVDMEAAGSKLWLHVLAIASSPSYLSENADAVKRDWPRVALPANTELLNKSADLGTELAALLDPDTPAPGVTTGKLRPEIASVGNLALTTADPLDPAIDLRVTKGWGHKAGKAINPGKGKTIAREFTTSEREAIAKGAAALGISLEQAFARIGDKTVDVYLSDRAYWKNVPLRIWEFYIGGYQIIKKWLSYREAKILGRPITIAEADLVRDMARRLTAVCLLGEKLDSNYIAIKAAAYAWPVQAAANTSEDIAAPLVKPEPVS